MGELPIWQVLVPLQCPPLTVYLDAVSGSSVTGSQASTWHVLLGCRTRVSGKVRLLYSQVLQHRMAPQIVYQVNPFKV